MDKKVDNNGTEKEFKLFRQIEAMIDGILEFIIRFIHTTVFLALHPIQLKRLTVVGEKDISFSRPLTYLTITTVIFSSLARFTYKCIVSIFESFLDFLSSFSAGPNIGPTQHDYNVSSLTILRDLPNFSADSILKVALPTILVIVGVSAIMGTITQRFQVVQRRSFVQMVCYAAGFQFIIFSTFIFAFIELIVTPDLFSKIYILILILLFSIIILWPTIMLFSVLYNATIGPFLIRCYRKILTFTTAFIISLIVLCSASMVSIIPLLFETRQTALPTYIWSVKSLELQGKSIKARLILTNNRAARYLVMDKGMTLHISNGNISKTIQLALSAWSDYGRPVLEIKNGESKWIIVQGTVDKNTEQLLKNAHKYEYTFEFVLKGFENGNDLHIRAHWKL